MIDSGKAVFLSYASQDSGAALKICEALRAAGIDVWFDQSELRGGDAWDAAIRRQIKACSLFMPVISAAAQTRAEGYFRLEWKLAVDRSYLMVAERPFLVPVVIDATPQTAALVPDRFREVQWTRLAGGDAPPAFVERVLKLLSAASLAVAPVAEHAVPGSPTPPATSAPASVAAAGRHRPLWLQPAAVLLGLAAIVAVGFIAVERAAIAPAPAPVAVGPSPVSIPERSIAVLPFSDLSEKKDQEYFSDGLSEELIDLLAKVPDLRVPARTSSFFFKGQRVTIAEIAKALSVTHVLEGSVRKAGDTIRVSTQLIRADNGYHEWSQTYDRELKDVFKVQDDIAARVVEELQLKLPSAASTGAQRTTNPEAYNQLLLGKKLFDDDTTEAYARAVDVFTKAVTLDPTYAAAYARLAMAQAALADHTGEKRGFGLAALSVQKSVALAPDAADGYLTRAQIASQYTWNWDAAGADFKKALSLEPHGAEIHAGYAGLLDSLGRLPEALAAVDEAISLDPLRARTHSLRGRILIHMGNLSAASAAIGRSLELNPDMPHASLDLALIEVLRGQPDQAVTYLGRVPDNGWRDYGIGVVEYSRGHDDASRAAVEHMSAVDAKYAAYQIAAVYAWRRDKDKAFEWLEHAYDNADGGLTEIKVDPFLAPLRDDARYTALLRKMQLPL